MYAPEYLAMLPSSAVTALESLWSKLGARYDATPPSRADLRTTARAVVESVHAHELPPERLVIAIKASWAAHPEFRSGDDRHVPHETLSELVTMCVQEYFASSSPTGSERAVPIARAHEATPRTQ